MAATTTLTLGLVLRDVASDPYQRTREATARPDVVATPCRRPRRPASARAGRPASRRLPAPGVVAHSGPFPVDGGELQARPTADVQVVGRDTAAAAVDQPALPTVAGSRDGGAVVEAGFADALGLGAGDEITLDGRPFEVVGIAVSAAGAALPGVVRASSPSPCDERATPEELRRPPAGSRGTPAWSGSPGRAAGLAPTRGRSVRLNLRLADPADATAFVEAHRRRAPIAPIVPSWEEIRAEATDLARDAQILLLIGARLLGLLAVASRRRCWSEAGWPTRPGAVGLLKAVGGTPGLVAAVLLAEYVVVACSRPWPGWRRIADRPAAHRLGPRPPRQRGNAVDDPVDRRDVAAVALGVAGGGDRSCRRCAPPGPGPSTRSPTPPARRAAPAG